MEYSLPEGLLSTVKFCRRLGKHHFLDPFTFALEWTYHELNFHKGFENRFALDFALLQQMIDNGHQRNLGLTDYVSPNNNRAVW